MPGDEQRRQDALLRAVWAPPGDLLDADLKLRPDTRHGLDAYRGHARVSAQRALVHAYPTVNAMLGEAAMGQLGWLLWQHQPPVRGDLGEWGEGLAALMAGKLAPESGAAEMLAPWPWLADVARLDWARHRCERLAARPLDADALGLLAQADPQEVHLVLQAHVMLLDADWPVDALWRAHQLPSDQHVVAMEAALHQHAQSVATHPARQTVLLWWSDAPQATPDAGTVGQAGVQQRLLSPEQANWLRHLQAISLGAALQQASADFDFSAWLQEALRLGWLQGAAWRPDPAQ